MTGLRAADSFIQVWWLDWVQFALIHGHNPFFSNWEDHPQGINAGVNGAMIALGAVMTPVTLLFGPVVTWDILTRAALALSAFSMCIVLRRWIRWWPAAFLGGLLYGFSFYMTAQAGGYVFLTFVVFPPIYFLLLFEGMFRQVWRPTIVGALLAVTGCIQFLISSEVFASIVMIGAIGSVIYVIAERARMRARWPHLRRAVTAAIVVGSLLLLVPVAFTLLGPESINGAPNSPAALARLHGDVMSLVSPPSGLLIHSSWSTDHSGYAFGGATMYLGIPFIIGVLVTVAVLRKRGLVALCATLTALSLVLSLGATLYVFGHDTHIPLPFVVLAHLPLVDGFLSVRFSLFTYLFGSAILAFGAEELHQRILADREARGCSELLRRVLSTGGLAVVALVVVLPLVPSAQVPSTESDVAPFFSSTTLHARIPSDSVVLAYPYPGSPVFPGAVGYSFDSKYQDLNQVLLDQAAAGMPFKVIGGYGWRPATKGSTACGAPLMPFSVEALFDLAFYGVATSDSQYAVVARRNLTADLRVFLVRHHVGTILVLPVGARSEALASVVTAAIGAPTRTGGVRAWFDVPSRLRTVLPLTIMFGSSSFVPHLTTLVVKPASGQVIFGRTWLAASASATFGVIDVRFEITEVDGPTRQVITAKPFLYGWLGGWDTSTVPSGRYFVTSTITQLAGPAATSPGVAVVVRH